MGEEFIRSHNNRDKVHKYLITKSTQHQGIENIKIIIIIPIVSQYQKPSNPIGEPNTS
jgi:hypothetical protein